MLGQKGCFAFLHAGTRHVAGNAFPTVELGETTGNLLADGFLLMRQQLLVFVEQPDGSLYIFVDGLIRAALNVLFDELLGFGFEVNRRGTNFLWPRERRQNSVYHKKGLRMRR